MASNNERPNLGAAAAANKLTRFDLMFQSISFLQTRHLWTGLSCSAFNRLLDLFAVPYGSATRVDRPVSNTPGRYRGSLIASRGGGPMLLKLGPARGHGRNVPRGLSGWHTSSQNFAPRNGQPTMPLTTALFPFTLKPSSLLRNLPASHHSSS